MIPYDPQSCVRKFCIILRHTTSRVRRVHKLKAFIFLETGAGMKGDNKVDCLRKNNKQPGGRNSCRRYFQADGFIYLLS
jgi:hypothetical protein